MSLHLSESDLLTAISKQWEIDFVRLRPDLPLAGSPERTVWRSVVETNKGQLYVLEKVASRNYNRKRRIVQALQHLSDCGLTRILPYVADACNDAIPLIHHGLWQLCPFVDGVHLNRPAYAMDGWRGEAAAKFLIAFNDIYRRHPIDFDTPVFSIAAYSRELFATVWEKNPEVARRFHPFMDHLERSLFPVHDRLPSRFCHGDFHPLNIIWGNGTIRAVIDWEFCGIKPEIYDVANLLGCLGMEDPQSLTGLFTQQLIDNLKRSGMFSQESWTALPDLTLAIRFAWLAEWLRKDDRQMIRLEADYMDLLLSHRPWNRLIF